VLAARTGAADEATRAARRMPREPAGASMVYMWWFSE
jgi:hypothetical protein